MTLPHINLLENPITNSILPKWFFHEFAKTGIFLWVPEQLQWTWILEMTNKKVWQRWPISADKHHQWCQQSCLVFQICYNTITRGILGKGVEEEERLIFSFSFWKVVSLKTNVYGWTITSHHKDSTMCTENNFWVML